eukprot:SAG31_NODE_3519_length_4165_cov_2.486227_2_plen_91_part_00
MQPCTLTPGRRVRRNDYLILLLIDIVSHIVTTAVPVGTFLKNIFFFFSFFFLFGKSSCMPSSSLSKFRISHHRYLEAVHRHVPKFRYLAS